MSTKRILLVEDEEDLRELMILHLRSEGFEIKSFETGEDAKLHLEEKNAPQYDLAVFDWMLPGISGLQLTKKFGSMMPVLMVTARASSGDIVMGLESGADDYVTKPFEIPVFIARVNALLRRRDKQKPASDAIKIGNLTVHVSKVQVRCGKNEIVLTATEFRILVALIENAGRVLTRQKLIESVQGPGINVVGRTIDTHVLALRKKLGPCAALIETMRGIGYRLREGDEK